MALPTIAPTPKPSRPAPTALPSPAFADALKDNVAIPNRAMAAVVLAVLMITPVLVLLITRIHPRPGHSQRLRGNLAAPHWVGRAYPALTCICRGTFRAIHKFSNKAFPDLRLES
jgi:hypothetical protein